MPEQQRGNGEKAFLEPDLGSKRERGSIIDWSGDLAQKPAAPPAYRSPDSPYDSEWSGYAPAMRIVEQGDDRLTFRCRRLLTRFDLRRPRRLRSPYAPL